MKGLIDEELTFVANRLLVAGKHLISCIDESLIETLFGYETTEAWAEAVEKYLSDVESVIAEITNEKIANTVLTQYTANGHKARELKRNCDNFAKNEFYLMCLHRAMYVLKQTAKDYIRPEAIAIRTEVYGDYVFTFDAESRSNLPISVTFKGAVVSAQAGISSNLLYTIVSVCFPDNEIYLGDYINKFPDTDFTKTIDDLNKKLYNIDKSVGKQHIRNCKTQGRDKARGKSRPKTYQLVY